MDPSGLDPSNVDPSNVDPSDVDPNDVDPNNVDPNAPAPNPSYSQRERKSTEKGMGYAFDISLRNFTRLFRTLQKAFTEAGDCLREKNVDETFIRTKLSDIRRDMHDFQRYHDIVRRLSPESECARMKGVDEHHNMCLRLDLPLKM